MINSQCGMELRIVAEMFDAMENAFRTRETLGFLRRSKTTMNTTHSGATTGSVSRDNLESLLAAVEQPIVDPRAGLIGHESISRRINRETALVMGAGRA
ncbi:MAG: hypothetical protein ACLPH3_17870, partial [Terracidiphilus sp.]